MDECVASVITSRPLDSTGELNVDTPDFAVDGHGS
jgi:hypothetical protein